MARTRSPEIQKRNDTIYSEWLRGVSLTDLGERYGLARQVVGRIVAAQNPEGDEDTDRALFRGYMWRLYDEVQEIGERPGWKMSPNGSTASGPDGEPALDTNIQVQAKELQLKIIRELRLLDSRDRQVPKQVRHEFTVAQQQAMDDIAKKRAEMEELARRAVVPGQVVGELEAGDIQKQQRGEAG